MFDLHLACLLVSPSVGVTLSVPEALVPNILVLVPKQLLVLVASAGAKGSNVGATGPLSQCYFSFLLLLVTELWSFLGWAYAEDASFGGGCLVWI